MTARCPWRGWLCLTLFAALTASAGATALTTLPGIRQATFAPGSHADFKLRLWFHHAHGRFPRLTGEVDWSPRLDTGVVRAAIKVANAQLDNARHRTTLLGPDYLDARRYPRITFTSNPITPQVLAAGGPVRGDLMLHGITHPAVFQLAASQCMPSIPAPCTLHLAGSIQRTDYGMHAHRFVVGNRIELKLVIKLMPADATRPYGQGPT